MDMKTVASGRMGARQQMGEVEVVQKVVKSQQTIENKVNGCIKKTLQLKVYTIFIFFKCYGIKPR